MINYQENKHIEKNQLEHLYASVGCLAYTTDLSRLERTVSASLSVITAWDDSNLIGLVRGVGDGETILYVQDLLVHPDFQNRGIGTALLSKLLENYPEVRQKVLLTEEAPDVRSFYEKFNFVSCDKGNAVAFYKEY